MLGATIRGNRIEDSLGGATLSVEHSAAVKTSRGRVYASAEVRDNTFLWSHDFAAKLAPGKLHAVMILGDSQSLDPSELRVDLGDNHGEGKVSPAIQIIAAQVGSREVRNRKVTLHPEARPK